MVWTISARTPDCRRYRRPAAVPALDVINMKCTRTISVPAVQLEQLRRACVLANLTLRFFRSRSLELIDSFLMISFRLFQGSLHTVLEFRTVQLDANL